MSRYLSENTDEILFQKRFAFSEEDKSLFEAMYKDCISTLSLYSERVKSEPVTNKEFSDIYSNNFLMKMFVLNDAGEKVGFCLVGFGTNTHPKTNYYIAEFYILPKYRRMGIGKKAINDLFSMLPGTYCYHVLKSNNTANAFWDYILKDLGCQKFYLTDTSGLQDCDFYAFKTSMKE